MIASNSRIRRNSGTWTSRKVNIGIEGMSRKMNALYASGMQKENTYDQVVKVFNENGVTLQDFLTEKYALCLDLRPSTDSTLHGNGVPTWKTRAKASR